MGDRQHSLITDFSAGEMSPRWRARVYGGEVDTPLGTQRSLGELYSSGCEDLTNVMLLTQGGAAKRYGSRFAAYADESFNAVKNDGENYRVVAFRGSGTDTVLLWRPNEVVIYNIVAYPFTVFQKITTPYEDDELQGLKFVQSQDEMTILSKEHRPRVLKIAFGGFTLTDSIDRFIPPQFDFGDGEGSDTQPVAIGRDYTLTFAPFVPKERRVEFEVSRNSKVMVANCKLADDAKTASNIALALRSTGAIKNETLSVTVAGVNSFDITYEYWGSVGDGTGDMLVELRETDETKMDSDLVDNLDGVAFAQATSEPLWSGPFYLFYNSKYWLCIKSHRSATDNQPGSGANWQDFWVDTGATAPTEDVDLDDTGWVPDKAYYPRDRGWPTIGTFHEQRLILNGPPAVTNVVAGSRITTFEYLDFARGVNADDGFVFLVANDRGLKINWFLSQRKLFIGTTQGVYIQLAQPFTPTNFFFERHSVNPAAGLRSLAVNGELFYPEQNLRRIRKVQYVRDIDLWEGKDVTILAEHLFRPDRQVTDWAFQSGIDPVVWVRRSDGTLLSMTYDANYNISGWAKHNLGDPVLDVETLYQRTDEIMVAVVQRKLWDTSTNSFRTRPTIEVIEATSENMLDIVPEFNGGEGDFELVILPGSQWSPHVDSYEQQAGDGTDTLTIPRFAQRTVSVVENGVYLGDFMAGVNGVIQLPYDTTAGSRIYTGFRFMSRIRPNRLQFVTREGVTQSQKIRWVKPVLRMLASAMPLVNGQRARERSQDDLYDTASSLFSGDVDLTNTGSDTGLTIEMDLPLPSMLTGIFGLTTTEGG